MAVNLYDLGCSDGGCIIRKPRGMHTNGGCNCAKELRHALGFQPSRRYITALQERQRHVTELRALLCSIKDADPRWETEVEQLLSMHDNPGLYKTPHSERTEP